MLTRLVSVRYRHVLQKKSLFKSLQKHQAVTCNHLFQGLECQLFATESENHGLAPVELSMTILLFASSQH